MQIGIKVYSSNGTKLMKQYLNIFDFIELLPVPGEGIERFKKCDTRFVIHTSHQAFGFNLLDQQKKKYNERILNETIMKADTLDANKIIVHVGVLGKRKSKKCAINILKKMDKRFYSTSLPGEVEEIC